MSRTTHTRCEDMRAAGEPVQAASPSPPRGGAASPAASRLPSSFASPPPPGQSADSASIVQIFTNTVANVWRQPWALGAPRCGSGSGFVLDVERRLLVTCAHVVVHAVTLQVRADGCFDKHEARVVALAHDVDLALLTVADERFWAGCNAAAACPPPAPLRALPLGAAPRLAQRVTVLGYPVGGNSLSITAGIVSRVDWHVYSHSGEANLIATVDAPINAGNSGGPAMHGGAVVGVAFQSLAASDAENIGYIVPATLLRRLLEDVAAAAAGTPLRGFAAFAPEWQAMENAAMRAAVCAGGARAGACGVLITKVPAASALHGRVLPGDALVAIDGTPVSNDGHVRWDDGALLDFRARATLKLVGEPLALTLIRGGARLELVAAAERVPALTPFRWHGRASFALFAGLAFIPMHYADAKAVPAAFSTTMRYLAERALSGEPGEQVCGLAAILPHSLMLGYTVDAFHGEALLEVNGAPVRCLADLYARCCAADGEFITFLFTNGRRIILPLADARRVTADVMRDNRISRDASEDVAAAAAARAGADGGSRAAPARDC